MSERKSIRHAYGEILTELGKENNNIVVLDADLAHSTQTALFGKEFPDRHFNMGIAEANMCLFAAGLARQGKTVFASSFAMFLTGRAWEIIRNAIAHDKLNVKLVATHAGISVGEDGSSHQANEDIALMRMIPHMQVFVPCDYYETKEVIKYAASSPEPMYIRLSRALAYNVFESGYKFVPNEPVCVTKNKESKILIFSTGIMTGIVKEALILLAKENNSHYNHYHIPSLKPISEKAIATLFAEHKYAISFEEHSILGGLGDTLLHCTAQNHSTPLYKMGMNDVFGKSGNAEELFDHFKLSVESVAFSIKDIVLKEG